MSRRTGHRFAGAALAAGLLAAAGCAAQGAAPDAQGEARTLEFGVPQPPNSLDPIELHDGVQRYVWGSLFDTLLALDHEGELQPNAAESWSYSDDALTLTLDLRDDMSFSDGDPVTAHDVQGTLERTLENAGPQRGNLSAVESIDVPDDHTVVLNLSEPDDNLLVSLAQAAGVIGDPETLDAPETALDPVGSGPYTLNEERTQDGTVYVLDRRDDHWNADTYPFETVTIRPIQDRTAMFNSVLSGELDAGTVDPAQAEHAEAAGLTLTEVEGASLAMLVLADRDGTTTPALADVRVRQAVNMAIDRAAVVESLHHGLGTPTAQIFHPLTAGHAAELDETYPYDLEHARALMADAGYEDGFSMSMPGNIMSTHFQATLVQAFDDIGIELTWDPVPPQTSTQSTDWPAYWNIGGATTPSRVVAQFYAEDGSNNPFGTSDPKLRELLDAVAEETDPERADDLYRQINEFGVEQAWFSPVLWITTIWATAEDVEYVGSAVSPMDLRVFDTAE
ncbi:ABC transporter substrate-binding protein [Myceligenerans pegani]|uniref:ABC transporter substrate-binding protein n=1 Tax=Myceligenerans pegani TaxID=2776917 RepID=A0ABR9N3Q6_9MICO|nr:ABC transporter substrate-binding protein [Myceligenerans sp. TRM 65318]MBE1878297.1 ABC transporter substrate-binding protein [Myceligenerans sp. TRM 65318]MBE3020568.1 ABC transporter substrate-binding protein [Myceligenerans sp. TRM 65318]